MSGVMKMRKNGLSSTESSRKGLSPIMTFIVSIIIVLTIAALVLKISGTSSLQIGKKAKDTGATAVECIGEGKSSYEECFNQQSTNQDSDRGYSQSQTASQGS